jgi:hypothetical protein
MKQLVILILVLAVVIPLGYADSGGLPGLKALVDSLQKPVVNGNLTAVSGCISPPFIPQCPLAYPQGGYVVVIAGGITNYGTRTALNVNMTLFWTISYPPGSSTGTIQQNLGTFNIGNIPGRNTVPFSHLVPATQSPLPFTILNVNATYRWGGA